MQQWLLSGRLIDVILVAMLIEATALFVLHGRGARAGPRPLLVLTMLASGACLLLALRAALTQSSAVAILLPLSAALLAHIADLWARWRR